MTVQNLSHSSDYMVSQIKTQRRKGIKKNKPEILSQECLEDGLQRCSVAKNTFAEDMTSVPSTRVRWYTIPGIQRIRAFGL